MGKKWDRIPYRFKILLELSITSLLPILIFTFFSTYIIRTDLLERMDIMSAQRVEKIQERTDQVLWNIWENYFEIFMTSSVRSVMSQDLTYHDYNIYADAIEKLKGQVYLQKYIRGFTFINLETDWVLSNRGMYRFSEVNNREEVLNLLEKENPSGKLINSKVEPGGDLHHNTIDMQGVYMLFELPVTASYPQCVTIVNLNMDALKTFMEDRDEYDITMLDKEGNLLLTSDEAIADCLLQNLGKLEGKSWFRTEDGRKIRLSSILSTSDYFQYIVTYDSSLVGRESRKIVSLAAVLIAALLVTATAVIFAGKHAYRPVLLLTNRISDAVNSERGQNDDAIRFIERNFLDMMSTIRNQKNEMVKFLMARLLSGTIQEGEIQHCVEELELEIYPFYCVMALSPSGNFRWNHEMERNIFLNAIEKSVVARLNQGETLAARVWDRALIFLIGGESASEAEEKAVRIEVLVQSYLKENAIGEMPFGASQIFTSVEHTMKAYLEAMEAMKVSEVEYIRSGTHRLVMYADMIQSMSQTIFYSAAAESAIHDLVDGCREKEACVEAEKYIDRLYEERMSTAERRYYLYRLLLAILEVPHDAGLLISNIKPPGGKDIMFAFSQMYGNEEIKGFIRQQVIPGVIRQLTEFRNTHAMDIRDRVMKMIRKARGDITLAECAERLNYSTNYLGRILRCENNDSFSAYVAEQKLIYARSLLEETERSVADIARELNYSNTQNFIRFFSRRMGVSPGKYRERVREGSCGGDLPAQEDP